ncbi:MAG: efflux RND transporter periplasmic adaptor subunit [Syntrophomonadaceae bacterium]|nr:efflux RND transporter periplasmic adaptor subunit [Syntrophomonadaceae bacterium]
MTEQSRPIKLSRFTKRKKIIIIIAVVILAAIAVAYFLTGKKEILSEAQAVRQTIATYYNFTGNIEANKNQTVLSTGSQPVQKFYVTEGALVKAGDILVEFKNDTLEANITQSRANVEIAQINYEKAIGSAKMEKTLQADNALKTAELNYTKAETTLNQVKQLFESGASTQNELVDAQNALETAAMQLNTARQEHSMLETTLAQDARTAQAQLQQSKASLANLETQLRDSKIYADISGTVTEIFVEVNEQITMGTQIMQIIDYDSLKVEIKVDEYGLASVTKGQKVQAFLNASNVNVSGTVDKVAENATVTNGVSYFPATILLEKNDALKVGLSLEIRIVKEFAENVVAIPLRAVNTGEDRSAYVRVKDQAGVLQNRSVTVGINNGMLVEITEGLSEGETVFFAADNIPTTDTEGSSVGPGVGGPGGGGPQNVRVRVGG